MRVLFIESRATGDVLGIRRAQIDALAGALDRLGIDVARCRLRTWRERRKRVASNPISEAGDPPRIAPKPIGVPISVSPRVVWKLRRAVSASKPDVVHTWGAAAGIVGSLVAPHTVAWVAGGLEYEDRRSLAGRIARRIAARGADRIAVQCSASRRRFVEQFGARADRVAVIPPAVPKIAMHSATRDGVRARWGLLPQTRVIGLVSPLLPRDDVKEAIWAFELLRTVRPESRMIVVGDGPSKHQLMRFARLIDVGDAVRFVAPGDISAGAALCMIDVFWSVSTHGGSSPVVLQAMAAGAAVVAVGVAGADSPIESEHSGFLVEPANRAQMVRQTLRLLDDGPLCREMGNAAADHVEASFHPRGAAQRCAELYRAIPR